MDKTGRLRMVGDGGRLPRLRSGGVPPEWHVSMSPSQGLMACISLKININSF